MQCPYMQENEYQINQGLRVVANRQNSVQVTLLGGGSELIFLIKFSNASSAEEFLMKVNNDPGEYDNGGN